MTCMYLLLLLASASAASSRLSLRLVQKHAKEAYPYQPTPAKPSSPGKEPLPFGTGSILSVKSFGLDLFCMVSSCPPEDWDCEGLLTCDEKDPGSVNQGLMISGTDPQSREIHCGDQVMFKSQQTNKYCSPSDPNSMSIVSCAERHYDDESLFVIQKVDHRIAGDEELMRYPGWGPDQPSGSTPPGPDVVKAVIRFHPADSPHSWCHVFRSQVNETNGIRCGGSFVKGMELFEVVDVGGGGGSWVPPSQGHLDDE